LLNNLKELYENIEANFTGIFLNSKLLMDITSLEENKKKSIKEKLSHLIEKSGEIEEIFPDFGKKYLYAEGEEFGLFVFYVDENISIGSIFDKKPKFAAILLEHEIFTNKLKKEKEILEKIKSVDLNNFDLEKALSENNKKEDKSNEENLLEEFCEIFVEPENQKNEDELVPSLEDLIQESFEEYEKISTIIDNDRKIEERVKEERQHKEEYVNPIVLEHIEKEFVKEIGPIAKLILNRKLTELNINPKKLKTEDVVRLIEELAKEIRMEEQKEKFLNGTNDLL
ncbi:MAG: hypothetical protein GXO21_06265, partial [Aquificae bacterium]|nr:hypothetical protein [Aquificota bacterium]